ncbi:DUF4435 domain-containing protein [Pseudomonas sp. SB113]|uniref:DUF4435 domain-containing protein n=1 Tax=Pseudomonas sp. SB113 TaxID=3154123 RepID=UPI00345DF55D
MSSIPRRSIDELLARYEYEPELKDVYVEGVFDKEVFSMLLEDTEGVVEAIYEIDSVDVPADVLAELGLTSGNKQRVIALAKKLSVLGDEPKYRCVVDKDLDHWLMKVEDVPKLFWTAHTSIEMYFFTADILRRILLVGSKAKIANLESYSSSAIGALRSVYAMRLVDRELDWCMEWVDPTAQFSERAGVIFFNEESYVRRLLSKNNKMALLSEFNAALAVWQAKLLGDPRSHIRGHDFVSMLAWSVKEFKGLREFQTTTAIERMLILTASKATDLMTLVR